MPFEKGKASFPNAGRPRLPKMNKLTREKVIEIMTRLADMQVDDLKLYIKSQKGTALEMSVAAIMAKAITEGDTARLEFVLNRTIGKVVDRVDVGMAKPYILEKVDGTELELGAAEMTDEDKADGQEEV